MSAGTTDDKLTGNTLDRFAFRLYLILLTYKQCRNVQDGIKHKRCQRDYFRCVGTQWGQFQGRSIFGILDGNFKTFCTKCIT